MDKNKVGYGKPPKEHQFRKGKSGNPSGRPKKQKQKSASPSDAEILKMLSEETFTVDGQEMSARELEFRVLRKKALNGDIRAIKLLEEMRAKAGVVGGKRRIQGVLRLPPKQTLEEWKKDAEKNQAQYRENRRDDREGASLG